MARPDNFTPGTPGGGRPGRPDVGKAPKTPSSGGGSGSSVREFLSWIESIDMSNYDPGVVLPKTRKGLDRWINDFRRVVGSGMRGRDIPIDKPQERSRVLIMEKYIADQLGLDAGTITPEQFRNVVGEDFEEFAKNLANKTSTTDPTPERVAAMGGGTTEERIRDRLKSYDAATAPSAEERAKFVKPEGSVKPEVSVPGGEARSWYSEPFDFFKAGGPTADAGLHDRLLGVVDASMTNDTARLALRKFADNARIEDPTLKAQVQNYLKRMKKTAVDSGTLSEEQIAAFDSDASAPSQNTTQNINMPDDSSGDTTESIPIRDRNAPLGVLKRVQTQTGTSPAAPRTKKDLPPVPATSAPSIDETNLLKSTDTVQIVGQATRPNGQLVTEGQQTNKPFLNRVTAASNGQFEQLPVRGNLHQLRESFIFEQVAEDGTVLGYFEVPTTGQFNRPVEISEADFTSKISVSNGDPELDLDTSTPVSDVNDYDGFYGLRTDATRRQSSSMSEVVGDKPELPETEAPTLANDKASDWRGRPYNPNSSTDLIRSILSVPKALQESSSGILRTGGNALESLISRVGGGKIRDAAANQVIPGVENAPLAQGAKIARNRPVNEVRLGQILGSMNTADGDGFTDLSAEDLGVIYHAYLTDPDGLYDSLTGAASRGESQNAAVLQQLADGELDLNRQKELIDRVALMRDTSVTQSEVIKEMLYDSEGVPKTNLDKFSSFVESKLQSGVESPNNFETLMAIEALGRGDARNQTPTPYDGRRAQILKNENVDVNAENAVDPLVSSSRLAGDQRAYQEALDGKGLGFYGPLGKSVRNDAAVNLKLQEAQKLAYEIRQDEVRIRSGEIQGEELAQLKADRELKIQGLGDLSREIGRIQPGVSAADTYAGVVQREVGNQNPTGQRVTRKPIEEDPDSGLNEDGSGFQESAVYGDSADKGFNSFGDGLMAMITRLDPETASAKIAGGLSGDPAILKEFKVRTPDDFRDGFLRQYLRSELGRMGGEVVTPGDGFEGGATARQAGVPFPSTEGIDVAEVLRLLDRQSMLRQQLADEMSMFDVGFGRGVKAGQQGMGFLGSRTFEYGNRRAASIQKIEKIKQELDVVNSELDQTPNLAVVRDKIDGALEEMSANKGLTPQERASLEKKVELGGWRDPYGSGVKQAKPTAMNRIQQLMQYLDPVGSEVKLPVRGSNDMQNFLENYQNGSLPTSKGRFQTGDLPLPNEINVQGSRLTFTPEEISVMEQIASGVGEIAPETKDALLATIGNQQRWVDMTIKQSLLSDSSTSAFASSIDLDNLPPSHVAKGSLDGSDSQELVPNPAYANAITARAQTPEQQAAVMETLQPLLDYKTQLINVEQATIRSNVRTGTGTGDGSGQPVKIRTADDFKDRPVVSGLEQYLGDPRRAEGVTSRPIDFAADGINTLYTRAGSTEEGALGLFTGDTAANGGSFGSDVTMSAGDQQVALLTELKRAGMNIGYDFGNLGHLGKLEPLELDQALSAMERSALENTVSTDGQPIDGQPRSAADRYTVSNAETNARAIALIQQARKNLHKIQDPLGKAPAAFFDTPVFENGAFMVSGPNGEQAYIQARMSPSGFGSMGRVPMDQKGDLYIPVGLDESSMTSGMSDTRAGAKPVFSTFSINNGRIAKPAPNIGAENTKAVTEAIRDVEGTTESLADLSVEDRLRRARSGGIAERAAAKRAALAQTTDASQPQYVKDTTPESVDPAPESTRPSSQEVKPVEEPGLIRNKINDLKREATGGRMAGRAAMGAVAGGIGIGISEMYRKEQEREAARNNMIAVPQFSTEKTPEEELIERLRGQRKLKSMTTQVPVMGSGVR